MASCITDQWISGRSCPQVQLTVTESSSTATTSTLSWTLQYVAYGYAAEASGGRSYTVNINGETVKTGTYDINGVSSTRTIASGTKTISKSTSSQSISFSCSFEFALTWSGVYAGTKSASGSISISAKTSYTISYNANGGSGAPSSQTKWAGTNITLSSTKPTRTGYTFSKWNTNSSGTGTNYNSGATYSANAGVTLYAVWTPNTYTVSYDANGGSGAPSNQTKTYGQTLTLSSTRPTRTNYNFKGWGTSASSTSIAYDPGASYTDNAAIMLYAVWEIAYIKPRISDISVQRCASDGNPAEDGTNINIVFDWECDYSLSAIDVSWDTNSIRISGSSSDTSGSVNSIITGPFSTEEAYSIAITVSDKNGSSSVTRIVETQAFPIDFKAGGKGVCIGGVAKKDNTFVCKWPAEFSGSIQGTLLQSTAHTDLGGAPTSYPVFDGSGWIYHRTKDEMLSDLGYGDFAGNIIFESGEQTDEHAVRFKNTTGENTHNCSLYGGNPNSPTGIGLWDTKHNRRILAYLDNGNDLKLGNDSCYITSERRLRTLAVSSGAYMNASQAITLSDRVSNQLTGIIVAWSYYSSSSGIGMDYDWNYTFIPKEHVLRYSGAGIDCPLIMYSNGTLITTEKYIYVADTTISGNDYNSTGNARLFVLRAVYGV